MKRTLKTKASVSPSYRLISTGVRRNCWVLLALSIGVSAETAAASPEFPGELQEALNAPCAPPCTVCHESLAGGEGTASKNLALTMDLAGLEAEKPETVAPAARCIRDVESGAMSPDCPSGADLAALEALSDSAFDPDEDGVPTLEELTLARNPEVPGAGNLCPAYGCGAEVKPLSREGTPSWPLLFGSGFLAWFVTRRRFRAR